MKEADIEVLLQAAKEKHPKARPRLISDNGPQFIAADFKEFIRISGMTHVRTSPYYPQLNCKLERWHKSLKSECIRPGVPLTEDDACRLIARYVAHYNYPSYCPPRYVVDKSRWPCPATANAGPRRLRRERSTSSVAACFSSTLLKTPKARVT